MLRGPKLSKIEFAASKEEAKNRPSVFRDVSIFRDGVPSGRGQLFLKFLHRTKVRNVDIGVYGNRP